jgi:hypothetical protein
MAWYKIHSDNLTAIADSIRAKNGSTDPIAVTDMPMQIEAIVGGGASEDVRYVTFMSENGATELYRKAVATGDDCVDVAAKGLIDKQTKEPTNTEVFTQNGWSLTAGGVADASALTNVTEDRTVYAAFKASTRYYTVRFFDGETMLHTMQVAYGATADYVPTKDGFAFIEWQPSNANITQDTDCYAQWSEVITFANASWAQIAEISESGHAQEYFAVGDTKDILFNGVETVTVEIVGFNHDTISGGTNKAGISAICKTVPTSITEDNVVWGSPQKYPANLNNTVYAALPYELQSVVKSVTKQYDESSNVTTSPALTTHSLKVWLPSTTELGVGFSLISASIASSDYPKHVSTLGTVYEAYKSASCPADKGAKWHTRTLWRNNTNYPYIGALAGADKYTFNPPPGYGLAFGFCI